MSIGKNIRQIANKKQISFYRLSKTSGVSQSYLNDIVNEKASNPSLSILLRIATGLDVTVNELINQ